MKFQVNDIVKSAPGWSPGVFVITAIHPTRPKNPYDGVSLVKGKTFRLSEEGLADKRVGVVDQGWNNPTGTTTISGNDQSYLNGQIRARREINLALDRQTCSRWEKLASLKPGDTFDVNLRGRIQRMTFRYVTDRGHKYVFVAENESGTRYKYPLSIVIPD